MPGAAVLFAGDLILTAAGAGNALSRVFRGLGRIERTLFTLQWLSDPALRQRSHAGLNKGEASNAVLSRILSDNGAALCPP